MKTPLSITRYRNTRYWAIWQGGDLLAVTVYRKGAEAILHEISWPALVNFGVAPSVKGEPEPLFEAHLLGAEIDLYDANLTLSFDAPLIRPERKFPSLDALRAQIHADLEACQ